MVGTRINTLPSVTDYTDSDCLIVEQAEGTRKGTFKQVSDNIVNKIINNENLSANLITASGAVSATGNNNGMPLKGRFHLDNGFEMVADKYATVSDNGKDTLTVTDTPNVLSVAYNYQVGWKPDRYPNELRLGSSTMTLYIAGSSVLINNSVAITESTLSSNTHNYGALSKNSYYKQEYIDSEGNIAKANLLYIDSNGSCTHVGSSNSSLNLEGADDKPLYGDRGALKYSTLLTSSNASKYEIEGLLLSQGAALRSAFHSSDPAQASIKSINLIERTNDYINIGDSHFQEARVNDNIILTTANYKKILGTTSINTSDFLSLEGGVMRGDIILNEKSGIAASAFGGSPQILTAKSDSGVRLGYSSQPITLNCTNANINGAQILTQYNYTSYLPISNNSGNVEIKTSNNSNAIKTTILDSDGNTTIVGELRLKKKDVTRTIISGDPYNTCITLGNSYQSLGLLGSTDYVSYNGSRILTEDDIIPDQRLFGAHFKQGATGDRSNRYVYLNRNSCVEIKETSATEKANSNGKTFINSVYFTAPVAGKYELYCNTYDTYVKTDDTVTSASESHNVYSLSKGEVKEFPLSKTNDTIDFFMSIIFLYSI